MIEPDLTANGSDTFFASAERANSKELDLAIASCRSHPILQFLLQNLGDPVLVLNAQRQVLAANEEFRLALGLANTDAFIGLRPGEVLECVHRPEGPNGCGTAFPCADCGMLRAIQQAESMHLHPKEEWLLSMRRRGVLDAKEFEVGATLLEVGPHTLTVIVLHDVSAAKRREALERVFYHDLNNLLQGIQGWSELLASGGVSQAGAEKLVKLTSLLNREVKSHRNMALAEAGTLRMSPRPIRPSDMLEDVEALLSLHPAKRNLEVRIEIPEHDEPFDTDADLLHRILTNMAVNGLEASAPGEVVTLSARWNQGSYRFCVHNPGQIPSKIRSRIFHRSFSTKEGLGRGLGTYAMKLFGENVLKGSVGFISGADGTTFYIDLPARASALPGGLTSFVPHDEELEAVLHQGGARPRLLGGGRRGGAVFARGQEDLVGLGV